MHGHGYIMTCLTKEPLKNLNNFKLEPHKLFVFGSKLAVNLILSNQMVFFLPINYQMVPLLHVYEMRFYEPEAGKLYVPHLNLNCPIKWTVQINMYMMRA